MTEEVKKEDEIVNIPAEVIVPEFTEIEHQAIDAGWKPKEDFIKDGGNPDEWRPAKEFQERGDLFRKIENLGKELKNTRSTLNALKGHYEKVKEVEFKNALESLRKAKKDALESGDADRVIAVDERMAEVRDVQKAQARQEVAQPEVHPDFTNWVSANQWYTKDTEMQAFADSIGRAYATQRPGVDPVEVLRHVTSQVKKAYPEKFENPRRSAPGATETPRGSRATKEADYALSDDEQRVMNKLVSQNLITKEKYIAELKKIKGEK